jgi:hypothetical protein
LDAAKDARGEFTVQMFAFMAGGAVGRIGLDIGAAVLPRTIGMLSRGAAEILGFALGRAREDCLVDDGADPCRELVGASQATC